MLSYLAMFMLDLIKLPLNARIKIITRINAVFKAKIHENNRIIVSNGQKLADQSHWLQRLPINPLMVSFHRNGVYGK